MSIVSGVIVCCSCSEDDDNLDKINAWLGAIDDARMGHMRRVERSFGGTKHPQMYVFGAGLNYFGSHVDKFVAFVLSLTWEYRGNLLIIHQPEEGPTQVWRPADTEFDGDGYTR